MCIPCYTTSFSHTYQHVHVLIHNFLLTYTPTCVCLEILTYIPTCVCLVIQLPSHIHTNMYVVKRTFTHDFLHLHTQCIHIHTHAQSNRTSSRLNAHLLLLSTLTLLRWADLARSNSSSSSRSSSFCPPPPLLPADEASLSMCLLSVIDTCPLLLCAAQVSYGEGF